jgi:hypothetical protein
MRFSLNAVFHLAAGAVELLVEVAGLVLLARQRGEDKARIGLASGPFRVGDDPACLPGKSGIRRRVRFLHVCGSLCRRNGGVGNLYISGGNRGWGIGPHWFLTS